MNLEELKEKDLAPVWLSSEAFSTLSNGYLLSGETPYDMYKRLSTRAASILNRPDLEPEFFHILWNNWLCPSTPVASNFSSERGLPISCLTADTWINTICGGKQMGELSVGDLVLSHTGNWRKVVKKWYRMSTDDLYELKVGTRNTPTKITGNHPVLTNLGWVKVDDLVPGVHLVATNKNVNFPEVEATLKLSSGAKFSHSVVDGKIIANDSLNRTEVFASVKIDEDVAWFLGIWFAEGSLTINDRKEPNGIRITVGSDELHFAERFAQIAKDKFGANGNVYTSEVQRNSKSNKWITVNVNSGVIGNYFCDMFGKGCKEKNITQDILNLPKLELEQFLQGVLDGDGSIKKSSNRLTLSNPKLLLSMYNIALKLGKPVSLQMQEKAGKFATTRYVYTLFFREMYKASKSKNRADAGIEFSDGLVYCPIDSLKKLSHNEEVFDIEVEEDHSFSVAGVVVHNCYGTYVPDSIDGIFQHYHEVAMLTKNGGGVGSYWGNIRSRGTTIKGNGKSEGVVPWLAVEDRVALSVGQGGVRRAGLAEFLDIEHGDAEEFMKIRRPLGDVNRQCLNLHHGLNISDNFLQEMLDGNKHNRQLWTELLRNRVETGEPYMMFSDTAQRTAPFSRKINNTQLCTEIFLPNDEDHTYVCCLSSLNLARWDEWKDHKFQSGLSVVELSVYFLDAVMSEFISKARNLPGFEKAVRFAEKSRALGLGVLGYHTLLQSRFLPFDSFQSMMLNAQIFSQLERESDQASKKLADLHGIPEWCVEGQDNSGYELGRRNLTLLAVAPTMSNSIISGGMSAGIEPIAANCYSMKSAKGTFIRKSKQLEQLLTDKGINNVETWEQIIKSGGSVQTIKNLSEEEKEIFKTAREINQFAIVKQAGQRQKFIDQGQSVNLFFTADASARYIHEVHLSAWQEGLKSLYYLRSESVLKGQKSLEYSKSDCASCEG